MRAPVGVAGAQVLRPPPAASQVHQKEAGLEAEAGLKPGHSHPSGSLACTSEGPSEKTQYFTIFYNLFLFERRQGWGEQEERGRETGASADWLLNVRQQPGGSQADTKSSTPVSHVGLRGPGTRATGCCRPGYKDLD